jgi:hypothetical protein
MHMLIWVLGEDRRAKGYRFWWGFHVKFLMELSAIKKKECHEIERPFLDLGNEMTLYFRHLFHMTHFVISSGIHVDNLKIFIYHICFPLKSMKMHTSSHTICHEPRLTSKGKIILCCSNRIHSSVRWVQFSIPVTQPWSRVG